MVTLVELEQSLDEVINESGLALSDVVSVLEIMLLRYRELAEEDDAEAED